MIVIEVCDEHGRTRERFRADRFPVRIGRAYDNDLIVDDPYVCPHHCEVTLDEAGEVVVNDLGSVNGTCLSGDKVRTEQLRPGATQKLRLGHSVLCFRDPSQPVAATRRDPVATGGWPPRSLPLNLAVLLLGGVVMAVMGFLGSYSEFEYERYFFSEQIPALVAVATWASIWAIVSRITLQRFAFLRHATILVTVVLGVMLSEYLLEFLKFGFAAARPFEIVGIVTSVIAFTLLLYWHLRLCSEQSRARLLTISTVIAVVFTALIEVDTYLDRKEFRSTPAYSAGLKPPVFQLVESRPVESFLATAGPLREAIEAEVAEQEK